MAKIGDIVRFLNTTGGGKITRIDGQIAYVVDEDGFDVPVLLKECVVVAESQSEVARIDSASHQASPKMQDRHPDKVVAQAYTEETEIDTQIEETEEGDSLNLTIGFEPQDIKQLSTTLFDVYLVNDSNYYIQFAFATREQRSDEWILRYSGVVEPNIQLFMAEISRDALTDIERISFQYVAFKHGKSYKIKTPGSYESSFDNTRFFRLHCFKPNQYFDKDVIAVPVVVDDKVVSAKEPDILKEQIREINRKKHADQRPLRRPVVRRQKEPDSIERRNGDIVEVDLHIDELVDTTAGLSSSDMLNLQIDSFRRVMDKYRKDKGRRIVFIHGKGEGVLRNALMKELKHRYKGNDVQDASFREYGFGATQVTIR